MKRHKDVDHQMCCYYGINIVTKSIQDASFFYESGMFSIIKTQTWQWQDSPNIGNVKPVNNFL